MGYYTGKIMRVQAGISPEIDAYINGLTTPLSDAQVSKLDTFVTSVKTGFGISALSDAFDIMYILGGETEESSLRNLVKRMHDCTKVNSPNFTQYEGFKSNGTSSYIDTNYNAATQAVNYSLNNASNGVYSRTEQISMSLQSVEFGIGINPTFANSFKFGSEFYKNLNTNDFSSGVSPLTTLGMHIGTRYNSTSEKWYINKSNYYTNTNRNSTGVKKGNMYILCYNSANKYFSTKQLSFVYVGRSLNQEEVTILTDAFKSYMDSNGKGVI